MSRQLPFLLLVLVLAACAGDGAKQASPQQLAIVAEAAGRTTDATTAELSFEASIDFEEANKEINFTGEGAVDYASRRSRMTLDMSEFAESTEGELGDPEDWKGEVIYEAGAVYVRMPALTKALPEAGAWIKADAGALQEQGGAQFSAPNPDEFVQFVEAAGERAERVGEEDVRGVETTHYRAEINLDDLPRVVAPGRRAEMQRYVSSLKTAGVQRFPLDVWLDTDGLIRRVHVEYENMLAGGQETDVSVEMELYDFGAEVDVEAPPPGEVTDLADLIGRGAEAGEEAEVFP